MKLLIITGMSGAGKSLVANYLEDMGYYCVDNIPPAIIPAFVSLSEMGNEELNQIAVVTDIRGGEMIYEMPEILDKLAQSGTDYKILFLDASNEVLVNRYRENRRTHPLCEGKKMSLDKAVSREREMLSALREKSDYILDSSDFSIHELKSHISKMIFGNTFEGFSILCKSFGFKYGVDSEADLSFDVRCLPNPFYVEELKKKTGLDKEIRDYIFSFEESREFLKKLIEFIEYSVPLYIKEGKSRLVVSFGCTGGKHRSITFAETVGDYLAEKGYKVRKIHRDIEK